MHCLKKTYHRVMVLSRHKHAGFYLCFFSFLESFILPITPLILQVPMILADSKKALRFTCLATLGSIIGGIVGYSLGVLLIGWLEPHLLSAGFHDEFLTVKLWVDDWGVWALFFLALSPLPYKVTTLSAGILHVGFIPFLLVTSLARFLHFWFVGVVLTHGGKKLKDWFISYYSA